jgi:hypothetical protein
LLKQSYFVIMEGYEMGEMVIGCGSGFVAGGGVVRVESVCTG